MAPQPDIIGAPLDEVPMAGYPSSPPRPQSKQLIKDNEKIMKSVGRLGQTGFDLPWPYRLGIA